MKRLPRPFIAVIAALLLVFAQQGALAHMIGHGTGYGSGVQNSFQQDENSHDAALSLSHTCTTCIAFLTLAAAAPALLFAWLASARREALIALSRGTFTPHPTPAPLARGPPHLR